MAPPLLPSQPGITPPAVTPAGGAATGLPLPTGSFGSGQTIGQVPLPKLPSLPLASGVEDAARLSGPQSATQTQPGTGGFQPVDRSTGRFVPGPKVIPLQTVPDPTSSPGGIGRQTPTPAMIEALSPSTGPQGALSRPEPPVRIIRGSGNPPYSFPTGAPAPSAAPAPGVPRPLVPNILGGPQVPSTLSPGSPGSARPLTMPPGVGVPGPAGGGSEFGHFPAATGPQGLPLAGRELAELRRVSDLMPSGQEVTAAKLALAAGRLSLIGLASATIATVVKGFVAESANKAAENIPSPAATEIAARLLRRDIEAGLVTPGPVSVVIARPRAVEDTTAPTTAQTGVPMHDC